MGECKPLIGGLTDKAEIDNTTISGLSENITGLEGQLQTANEQISANGGTIAGLTAELKTCPCAPTPTTEVSRCRWTLSNPRRKRMELCRVLETAMHETVVYERLPLFAVKFNLVSLHGGCSVLDHRCGLLVRLVSS